MGKVSILDVADMKLRGEKIAMITAYDYTTAQLADRAGIPLVLVGDSLGMVVLGYDSTIPVTMEDMLHHAKAVARGVKQSLIVVDLPFMSYQVDAAQGLANAGRLMQEGGAHSVKLEGGEKIASTVARIVDAGILVMGHIGLTPQSVHGLGGYRVQGRQREQGEQLIRDALAQEDAGAYSVVLEVVPPQLAGLIPRQLKSPTIGIGPRSDCDGQVQASHDLLRAFTDFVPKHVKRYATLADPTQAAFTQYLEDVKQGLFPTKVHSISMDEPVFASLETP